LLREQEEEADKEKVLSKGNIYENIVFVSNEDVLHGNKEVMYDNKAFGKDLF
jgi:hypothetical protein